MKIGIYSPYLNIMGGGERYVLFIASHLANKHEVYLFWDDEKIVKKTKDTLNIGLKRVNIIPNIFSKSQSIVNLLKKIKKTRKYDIFLYVTDGSLFFSLAKKNILIIHAPSHFPKKNTLLDELKLKNWSTIICYSEFIEKFIKEKLDIKPKVIYPPVDVNTFKPGRKENIILSVGRFYGGKPHSKKQDFLVKTFKELVKEGLKKWQLILVGNTDPNGEKFIGMLNKISSNYPILIKKNLPFLNLKKLYSKAKIYWHATGFEEDLKKYPERAEHFGISTVEAMASGCVPVVINAGAQPEIVKDKKTGFLFKTKDELKQKTTLLIERKNLLSNLSKKAQKTANQFSEQKFLHKIDEIIKN